MNESILNEERSKFGCEWIEDLACDFFSMQSVSMLASERAWFVLCVSFLECFFFHLNRRRQGLGWQNWRPMESFRWPVILRPIQHSWECRNDLYPSAWRYHLVVLFDSRWNSIGGSLDWLAPTSSQSASHRISDWRKHWSPGACPCSAANWSKNAPEPLEPTACFLDFFST